MARAPIDLPTLLGAVNTVGVTGVLIVGIWLGLRGDVVAGSSLTECQATRDYYVREYLRVVTERPP